MTLVIDASVACKWFLPEIGSEVADKVLTTEELVAPELIYCEVGNILWKRIRSGELSPDEADTVMAKFLSVPFVLADSRVLARSALAIAARFGRTFYDSMYLALAVARSTVLVTADERMVNSLAATELAGHVRLLGT